MGGAPVLETIRPGVVFTPDAAASFRRAEHDLGRRIDVNSSTRDWDQQMSMYLAWEAWVNGTGPKPPHARAVHPKYSKHCTGLAVDSDDWTRPGFNAFMAEHGWIRVAADDPTEQHHFEYQWWRDQHRNRPAPAGNITTPTQPEEDMKPFLIWKRNPNGTRQWALISGDLSRMVPVWKLDTANALGKQYGPATLVVQSEWDGFVRASEIEVTLIEATEPDA